jgi:hypothetical protein
VTAAFTIVTLRVRVGFNSRCLSSASALWGHGLDGDYGPGGGEHTCDHRLVAAKIENEGTLEEAAFADEMDLLGLEPVMVVPPRGELV